MKSINDYKENKKMYSGGESSGEGLNSRNQFNNWQLATQSACTMSGNNVDWAALAQQWIQMRETTESADFSGIPEPPPPPIITKENAKSLPYEEQGEADMEVEKDDENEIHISQFETLAHQLQMPQTSKTNQQPWFIQQEHQIQGLQHPQPWNNWQSRVGIPPPTLHIPVMETNNIYKSNSQNLPLLKTPIMSSDPNKVEIPPMDASKRKILPAWIREGLEKMEREKAKQQEYPARNEQIDLIGHNIGINTIKGDNIEKMVNSRLIETESEKSGSEDEDKNIKAESPRYKLRTAEADSESFINSGKTHEEKVEELMFVVRRSLTALLLEVTNEEIISISQEALKKHKAKASAALVFRKSALTSITGNLGLGAYADSSSENSESERENNENAHGRKSDRDGESDEEIKAIIRSRKRAFAVIEEEIEELVAKDEAKKEKKQREQEKVKERDTSQLRLVSRRSTSPVNKKGLNKDIGETEHDKKNYSNGKNRKRERTSRFSDNKDSKYKSASSAPYFMPPTIVQSTVTNTTLQTNNAKSIVARVSDKTDKLKSSYSLARRHSSNSADSSSDSKESYDKKSNNSKSKYPNRSSSSSKRHLPSSKKSKSKRKSRSRRHNSSDSDDNYHSRKSSRHRSRSYTRRDKHKSETRSRSSSESKSKTHSTSKRSKRN